jgi:hypothetical protein
MEASGKTSLFFTTLEGAFFAHTRALRFLGAKLAR